jgi:hypothetical protein
VALGWPQSSAVMTSMRTCIVCSARAAAARACCARWWVLPSRSWRHQLVALYGIVLNTVGDLPVGRLPRPGPTLRAWGRTVFLRLRAGVESQGDGTGSDGTGRTQRSLLASLHYTGLAQIAEDDRAVEVRYELGTARTRGSRLA